MEPQPGSAPAENTRGPESQTGIQAIYSRLWAEAITAFKQAKPQIDPHLNAWQADSRRG